jgi:hypothetical protein
MSAQNETRRLWQDQIKRQKESGLNAAEFCRQHEISQANFYAWRTRLRREDHADGFVEIPTQVPVGSADAGVALLLPNGIRMALDHGFDEDVLRRALNICHSALGA